MALDPFHQARACPLDALEAACLKILDRGFSVVPCPDGSAITLFRSTRSSIPSSPLAESDLEPADAYELLDGMDVVAVAGAPEHGTIRLTGGSASSCDLVMDADSVFVRKQLGHSTLPAIDSIERHRTEARWIESLQGDGPGHLFPRIQILNDTGDLLSFRSVFLGCYTLGEWFLQRAHRKTRPDDRHVVEKVFEVLRENLYRREATPFAAREAYVDKLQRRLLLVLADPRIGVVARSLCEEGGIVNGLACRPLYTQLRQITEPPFAASLSPARPYACHGDLIPEDILVDRSGHVVAFVDPNPQNADPLLDVGKFVMSCCAAYDLALRDWMHTVAEPLHGGDLFAVTTSWNLQWHEHAIRQAELGRWIAQQAHRLLPSAVTADGRASVEAIFVLAGLQAACIVPFHLLHHNRPQRALHFLASGQALLERGLAGLDL